MTALFTPMTDQERVVFESRYFEHLRRRNGEADLATQRFSHRESFFRELEASPVRWEGKSLVDQAVFDRNEGSTIPERGLDEVTLWALAMAKANRGERFAVEYGLKFRGPSGGNLTKSQIYIEIEEFYHTRLLKDALQTIGINMEMRLPPVLSRAIIQTMVRAPTPIRNVLVLCGEIGGVALFRLLRDKAREFFGSQPKVMERLEALFEQIIVDEAGHVHYVRSQMGRVGLVLARSMLPAVARGMLDDMPELDLLFGRTKMLAEINKFDIDGAAAGYAGRFETSMT